jgi:hypothetical protein
MIAADAGAWSVPSSNAVQSGIESHFLIATS